MLMVSTRHIVRELLANAALASSLVRRLRDRLGRTTRDDIDAQATLIFKQFDFFLRKIGREKLQHKVVVELGPGDAIPLALLFLGAGASRYIAVDKYLGNINSKYAQSLYRVIVQRAPDTIVQGWKKLGINFAVHDPNELLSNGQRVQVIPSSIEDIREGTLREVDYIVSFNVLEHLRGLKTAIENMKSALCPTGVMVHRVDYGPHDVWTSYRNPLTFLTIPEWLWKLMGSRRGYPNRLRHRKLVEIVRSSGMVVNETITGQASKEHVEEIRLRNAAHLRHLSADDLAVLDAELVCSCH